MLTVAAMCLAQNMFFEARNEGPVGMMAVGVVTLNRVHSPKYPDNVCDVVWQRKQFSWTHDGKHDDPSRHNTHFDQQAWKDAQSIATQLLSLDTLPETGLEGATMYHADYVQPYWTTHFEPVKVVGSHIFYK